MEWKIVGVVTTLLSIAAATPTCKNITVPVNISARNGKFPESLRPHSGIEVTNFFLDLTRLGTNYTQEVLEEYSTISGTYKIAATYCEPASGGPNTLQILTHGVGFDRSYWNLPFNDFKYSYTNTAVDEYGFAIFTYDRLGIGESQHGDPLNFVQSWSEMAALESLTNMLRAGSINGVPRFKNIVHVGHSYGSIQTAGLLQTRPNLWDGVALTGFSTELLYLNFFELAADWINAKAAGADLPVGYFAPLGAPGIQESLLAPHAFDPALLEFLEGTGVPPAMGEFLTLDAGNANQGPPTAFTGPALVVTGEYDLPFCGGNCMRSYNGYENIPSASKELFPKANRFETVIVPKTGHGLNLQYSHPFTYNKVNQFFIDAALGP